MSCGVCGKIGHNVQTCKYNAKRTRVAPGKPKNKRCECCGNYGYAIERHHTKGRGDNSDYLDVCNGCHLDCAHGDNTRNLAIKPRYCRYTGEDSYWRT